MNGRLRLRAEFRGGKTVLTEVFRTPPFVVGAASYRSDPKLAEVIVQQASPGLLPGDAQEIEISVATGARLVLRAQSATKVFPCAEGKMSHVCARYVVEPEGELVMLPGELIPFRDAACMQTTEVLLAPGARFITGEIITPGRTAMGECNLYRRLDLRLTIHREARPLLIDRSVIEPPVHSPQRLGVAGPFPCTGSLYLAGFGDLRLGEIPERPDLQWAAGSTGDLTTLRILGQRAADILTLRDDLARSALNPSPP
jgi:urease accessory protein UreH